MLKSEEIYIKVYISLKLETLNNLENKNKILITYKKIYQQAITGIGAFK